MIYSKVYNVDCNKKLQNYKDNQFDLAVIDPPYGIGETGAKNKSRCKLAKTKDYNTFVDEVPSQASFNEIIRVSKNQIIWGANHFIDKIPFASPAWIVWDKLNGKTDFADCELAYTSFKKAVRIFKFKWQGMLQNDMKNKEIRIHPTQKPQALYKFCFEYANLQKGMSVLDTGFGSGNSRIVAYKMGFNYVGMEIEKHFFDDSQAYFDKEINGTDNITNIKQTKLHLL